MQLPNVLMRGPARWAPSPSVIDTADLDHLDAQQLRELVLSLRRGAADDKLEIARRDHEIAFKQAAIDKLTHEMAVLKRLKFAAKSEAFNPEQKSLLEDHRRRLGSNGA